MNIPPSESSLRHRALKIAETHYRLSKNPSLQAETLALHYLSLATTALASNMSEIKCLKIERE